MQAEGFAQNAKPDETDEARLTRFMQTITKHIAANPQDAAMLEARAVETRRAFVGEPAEEIRARVLRAQIAAIGLDADAI